MAELGELTSRTLRFSPCCDMIYTNPQTLLTVTPVLEASIHKERLEDGRLLWEAAR